jgi:hypothetical protein
MKEDASIMLPIFENILGALIGILTSLIPLIVILI